MTEKVIHEVRFIETDEGYRIEINGDKDQMNRMGFDPERWLRRGMGFGFGARHGRHKHGSHHDRRRGRRHHMHGPFGRGFTPPWMWQGWMEEDVDEDDDVDVPESKA
ncbi:MAG: hypothetical protein KC421_13815 [Anaerolineales bacterium]|nr:hypothetical protein [Anaerolineales bacterium]